MSKESLQQQIANERHAAAERLTRIDLLAGVTESRPFGYRRFVESQDYIGLVRHLRNMRAVMGETFTGLLEAPNSDELTVRSDRTLKHGFRAGTNRSIEKRAKILTVKGLGDIAVEAVYGIGNIAASEREVESATLAAVDTSADNIVPDQIMQISKLPVDDLSDQANNGIDIARAIVGLEPSLSNLLTVCHAAGVATDARKLAQLIL